MGEPGTAATMCEAFQATVARHPRQVALQPLGGAVTITWQEYAGRVKVGKLDVDSNGNTAMRYNIRGIPTLLLFKGGRVVEQKVGAVGKHEVQKMLDSHVDAVKQRDIA